MADHDWTKMMMINIGLDACSWRGQVLTITTMMMVMMSAVMMMLMTMTAASRMAAHEKADWSVAARSLRLVAPQFARTKTAFGGVIIRAMFEHG